ncbi:MAG: thioesterase family protein [Ginsengibacter sp.]
MITYYSKVKVTYSDTDQMGYVHHNNYVKYYETARWEMFEQLGIPYKEVEEKGFMMPVVRMDLKFIKPAFYDEELTIETSLLRISGPKIFFRYKLFNASGAMVNKAEVSLAFILSATREPCLAPPFLVKKVNEATLNGGLV